MHAACNTGKRRAGSQLTSQILQCTCSTPSMCQLIILPSILSTHIQQSSSPFMCYSTCASSTAPHPRFAPGVSRHRGPNPRLHRWRAFTGPSLHAGVHPQPHSPRWRAFIDGPLPSFCTLAWGFSPLAWAPCTLAWANGVRLHRWRGPTRYVCPAGVDLTAPSRGEAHSPICNAREHASVANEYRNDLDLGLGPTRYLREQTRLKADRPWKRRGTSESHPSIRYLSSSNPRFSLHAKKGKRAPHNRIAVKSQRDGKSWGNLPKSRL